VAVVVTVTVNVPPPLGTGCVSMSKLIGVGGLASVTVPVVEPSPLLSDHARRIVPTRDAPDVFGAPRNVKLPCPFPVVVPLNVSQLASLVAVHVHPGVLGEGVTVAVPWPPDAASVAVDKASV
jgi:hypothetical protein